MEKTLDLSKQMEARGKFPTRVICTDAKRERPLISLQMIDGVERAWEHLRNGRIYEGEGRESPHDLVNVPEKRTVYVYLTTNATGRTYLHAFEKPADSNTFCGPVLASEKIEIVEGQFNADA